MKNKLLLLILIMLSFLFSCQQEEPGVVLLEEEYASLKEFRKNLPSVISQLPRKVTYEYLDSIRHIARDEKLATYARVVQVQYTDHTEKDRLNHDIKELNAIKEGRFFQKSSPYLKFVVCVHLARLYEKKGDVEKVFDLNFEGVQYIEAYPSIYHYEIALCYFNIDAAAGHRFDEHEIGKKANDVATKIALEYNHRQLAFMSIYNANLRRLEEGHYTEAIKYAKKSIELGGEETYAKKFISFAYSCLRQSYLKLAQLDSVDIIDAKYQALLEDDFFSDEQYIEYLLDNIEGDIAIARVEHTLEQLVYIEDYLRANKDVETNYYSHLLYTNMSRYWSKLGATDKALTCADLGYEYFMAMTYQSNSHRMALLELFEKLSNQLQKVDAENAKLIEIWEKLNNLNQLRYVYLKTKTAAYEQQLKRWSQKERELADKQIESEKAKAKLWGALFAMITLFLFILIYLMVQLSKRKKELNQTNKTLLAQSKIIEEQNFSLEESNLNLSNFAAIAAHDLKAPLRTIYSFTEILYDRYADKININDKQLFDFVINDCISLKDMIEGLLSYSKVSKAGVELSVVNIGDVITMTTDSLHHLIEETEAVIRVQENPPLLMGQTTQLKQLFSNLLCNALKFRKVGEKPLVYISFDDFDESYLRISVTDNGIGIAAKDQKEIFDIFKKVHSKKQYDGSGIGLSTCEKIVESHGGKIWVESELGNGATFSFTLKKGR